MNYSRYFNSLDKTVEEMKCLADLLVKYSFPIGKTSDEEVLACLKQREIFIDGYYLIIHFNKCLHENIRMESLQIFGKHHTFLPFSLIIKLANKFLGEEHLSYVEVMHHRIDGVFDEFCRLIYLWTVYSDKESGEKILNPFVKEMESCFYNGIKYHRISGNKMHFF